ATRTPVFARIWVLILLVGAVLTIVKWDSIATGPTGDAIAVIRMVQRDLAEAQSSYGRSHSSILYGANAILDEGWSKLQEKRYAEAISAAQEARRLLSTLPRRRRLGVPFPSASPRYGVAPVVGSLRFR